MTNGTTNELNRELSVSQSPPQITNKIISRLFSPQPCQYRGFSLSSSLVIFRFYVKKVLYGRVKLEHATALLRFEKKGIVQQLLHKLKYKGYEDIGLLLGGWLGTELKEMGDYNDIDIVIPVPLHKRKLKKRGYNQVEKFAKEVASILEVPYKDRVLQKSSSTSTQVFKKRIARWIDKDEVFTLANPSLIANKHILLCDDIITTGATIEACANELLKAPNVKISVVTMAIAQ